MPTDIQHPDENDLPSTDKLRAEFNLGSDTSAPRRGRKKGRIDFTAMVATRTSDDPAADTPTTSVTVLRAEQDGQVLQELLEIPVDLVTPNPQQPRTVFDDEALEELAGSLRQHGQLQPIVVRSTADGRYELVAGERRWRATKMIGRPTVLALVRHVDDVQMLRDALLENLHRANLNALEEAAAYQQLADEQALTHQQIADLVGKRRSTITNAVALLRLPESVQRRLAAGELTAGHGKHLASLADRPQAAQHLADRIVREGLSVRSTGEIITLGGLPGMDEPAGAPPRSRQGKRPRASANGQYADLAAGLEAWLDTRVRVEGATAGKGRIIIEFAAGGDDLERVLGLLGYPPAP